MYSALFFDIDGTLVSFKTHQIPQSTVDSIRQAKERGVGIYISTGRPLQLITNLKAIESYIDGYITTNGALCFVGEHIVNRAPIDKQSVAAIIDDCHRNDYCCIVVGESGVSLFNPKPIFDEVFVEGLNVTNIDKSVSAEEMLENENIFQLSPFFSASHEQEIMAKVTGCVSGRWHPAFTDITASVADKGKGLLAMAEYLKLDIAETMVFGDGGNDVAILRTAGMGVAMGNAGEEAKAAADYITTSVDDDGIMNALKHFDVI